MNTRMMAVIVALAACGGAPPENKPTEKAAGPAAAAAPRPAATARKVAVTISGSGYTPARIEANPGESLTLVFDRPDAGNCGEEVVFPSTGQRVKVPVGGTAELAVTAPPSGELAFTCGMDMYKGAVVVAGG